MARVRSGESSHELVLSGADDITAEDVARFWSEFVPTFAARHVEDWSGVRKTVEEARYRYGRPMLHRFERIAGRYGAFLFAMLEPLFDDRGISPVFGRVKPTLDVKSMLHLRLLALHVVVTGKDSYDTVIANPLTARAHAERMTLCSAYALHAILRYEALVYQSQKLRLLEASLEMAGRKKPTGRKLEARNRADAIVRRLFGGVDLVDFLKTQFHSEEDVLDVAEALPRFVLTSDAEVICVPAARPNSLNDEPV
jgi:hypothetical protein